MSLRESIRPADGAPAAAAPQHADLPKPIDLAPASPTISQGSEPAATPTAVSSPVSGRGLRRCSRSAISGSGDRLPFAPHRHRGDRAGRVAALATARNSASAASPRRPCFSGGVSGTSFAPGFRAMTVAAGGGDNGLLDHRGLCTLPRRALVAVVRGGMALGTFSAPLSCRCPVRV